MCVGPGSGQGQPPRKMNSLRDNKGSYRAEPAVHYLGCPGVLLKSVGECFETIGDAGERAFADRSTLWRAHERFVEIVGEHQRDEQHRALAPAGTPRGTGRRRPALLDHLPEQRDARFLAIATADDMGDDRRS